MESGKIWFVTGASADWDWRWSRPCWSRAIAWRRPRATWTPCWKRPARRSMAACCRWPWILAMNAACGARSTWRMHAFGGLDVVVNNAACARAGAAGSAVRRGAARGLRYRRLRRHERDTRRQRAQRGGHVFVSSILGFDGAAEGWRVQRGVRAGRPDRGPGRRSRPHGVRVTLVTGAARVPAQVARPLSRPRRPSTRHGICSWGGTPSIRRASRSNRCSKSWRAGARCRSPSVRSTSAAWPREAREGDAGRQDGSIPDRLASGLARP